MPFTTESTCQTFVNNLFEAPAGQNVGLTGYVCVGDGVDNKVRHYCISFLNKNDFFANFKGTCFGDSGSPFIVKKSGEER